MRTESMSLEEKIGQMFVGGFPGTGVSGDFARLVREKKLGNAILFSHNVESIGQLVGLSGELRGLIRKETGILPFISADEEGGMVSRLPAEAAIMPFPMAQAKAGKPGWIRRGAFITGCQLKRWGINFNLAPVLDRNTNRNNSVIGVRSFGADAGTVCTCAKEAVLGYRKAGILCSGKHFPGHGDTDLDSHLALPVLEKSEEELESCELVPFRRMVEEKIPAITVAHVVAPAISGERVPCTMSRNAVTGYLREKLHFDGLILSDCLEMNAVKSYFGVERGAVEAVKAGIDLVFVSHTAALLEKAMDAVRSAVTAGEIPQRRIDEAVFRILRAKERLLDEELRAYTPQLTEWRAFSDSFLKETLRPLRPGQACFSPGEHPLFVGIAPARTSGAANEVGGSRDFAHFLQESFGGTAVCLSMKPDRESAARAAELAKQADTVVFGSFNQRLYPEQNALFSALAAAEKPMAHIALGNPWDLDDDRTSAFRLPLYEYSERALNLLKAYFTSSSDTGVPRSE